MEKLNKVITAMECCRSNMCIDCPYELPYDPGNLKCRAESAEDVLELLKEYQRIMPCRVDDTVYHIHNGRVVAGTVHKIEILDAEGNGSIHVDFEEDDLVKLDCDLRLWNVDLFPTRESAEAVLKETCGSCKNGTWLHKYEIYKCRLNGFCQWEQKETN